MISRDTQGIEGDLDQEYGLIQEFTSEIGAMCAQVQDDQSTNQNISPSGLVIETDPRFVIDIESEQKEDQVADPSNNTSTSTRDNLTIEI